MFEGTPNFHPFTFFVLARFMAFLCYTLFNYNWMFRY